MVLAVLVGVLLATREDGAEPPARVGRLFTATRETVRTMVVRAGNGPPVAIERADDHWRVVAPVVTRADERVVGAIADVIGSIVGAPLFRLEDADPSQFGLSGEDAVELALIDGSGHEDRYIFGAIIPLDVGFVYTLDPRTGQIYKVLYDVKEVLNRDLYALRSKHFFHLAAEEIERIELEVSDADVIRLHREGLWWEMEYPRVTAADTHRVQELVDTIARLRATEFVDERDAAVVFAPRVRIQLTDAHGETETVVLGHGDDAAIALAGSDTTAGFGRVAITELLGLPLTVDRLVAATPLRFDPRQIAAITVTDGTTGSAVRLSRDDQGWVMSAPRDERADADAVFLALQEFMRIEIGVGELPPNGPPVGASTVEFELRETDGTVHRLSVIPPDAARPYAVARSSFHAAPFALTREYFDRLPRTVVAFEDRRMLRFDSRDAVALQLRAPDGSMRIEKRGNEWTVVAPRRAIAEQPVVWGLIFGLQDVTQMASIDSDDDRGERARRRLASDEATTITVEAAGGVSLGTMTFVGAEDAERMYVQSSTRSGIFLADRALFARVAIPLQRLEFRR